MLIECLVKREEPINVSIGNEKYPFELDDEGRPVANVWIEDHIVMFLGVDYLYKPIPGERIPAAVLEKIPNLVVVDPDPQQEVNDRMNERLADARVLPVIENMKRRDLMAELKEADVKFSVTAKNEVLRQAVEQSRHAE